METEKNFKSGKIWYLLSFVTFKEPLEKSAFLKIPAQAFESVDFLTIFLKFLGFWGSFSYKNVSYKKTCTILILIIHLHVSF